MERLRELDAALARKKAMVMSSIERVAHSGRHKQGWTFASDADYLDAIRPAMAEAGLAVSVTVDHREREEHSQTRNGNTRWMHRVTLAITLTCSETGASETTEWVGEGIDEEDKGIAKAITNAKKDYLKTTFLASSGDDVQASDAPPRQQSAPRHQHPAPKPTAKRAPDVSPAERLERIIKEIGLIKSRGAVLTHIVGKHENLSASETGRAIAILSEAAAVGGDTALDFLLAMVEEDVKLATKTDVKKAWKGAAK